VSGSGFKNKILEAIAAGTYIAATPLEVEFLPLDVQRKLLVADGAEALADQLWKFLENPAAFEAHLPTLREEVRREFTWVQRCTELLDIVAGLPARGSRARLP
jgi:glycosyltransferase involved in cell wall biosynthesis